jgi:hypothetical protein
MSTYAQYIYITSVFIVTGCNVTIPVLHRVKNIFVIKELIIATLFDRVLKVG